MCKMTSPTLLQRHIFLASLCAGLSACASPTKPSGLTADSLVITGPETLAPGESAHYTATARFSNGTEEDVTARAEWSGLGPATITAPGVALGRFAGENTIQAKYTVTNLNVSTVRVAEFRIVVRASGTFILRGKITDTAGKSIQARVDVVSGVGAGLFGFGPQYALYGVAGLVRLEVSTGIYVKQVHEINVTADGTQDFVLVPVSTAVDASGLWTLTIDAPSATCSPGLPAIGYGRSYRVALAQTGTALAVQISSPTLSVVNTTQMLGSLTGAHVSMEFFDLVDDFTGEHSFNLIDRLSPTETLRWAGRVGFDPVGSSDDAPIAGTLAGILSYWSGVVASPTWSCEAENHKATMQRLSGVAQNR